MPHVIQSVGEIVVGFGGVIDCFCWDVVVVGSTFGGGMAFGSETCNCFGIWI